MKKQKGVALSILVGNDSIIKNAEDAVGKYNDKAEEEKEILNTIEKYLYEHTNEENGGTGEITPPEDIPSVDENGLAAEDTIIKPDSNSDIQIVIPAGFAPAILNGSNTTTSNPGVDGSDIAQSKRKQNQWTDISPETAKTACKSNISSENMHLIYAIEWDTMLNWLKDNATISSATSGETKTMELTDIQTNSSSWGNYTNSTGNAANNSGSKQTTGYSEYWKANNIYDLAGNVREWTQEEYSTNSDYPGRGGYYGSDSNDGSAANRGTTDEYITYKTNGFRMSFYL